MPVVGSEEAHLQKGLPPSPREDATCRWPRLLAQVLSSQAAGVQILLTHSGAVPARATSAEGVKPHTCSGTQLARSWAESPPGACLMTLAGAPTWWTELCTDSDCRAGQALGPRGCQRVPWPPWCSRAEWKLLPRKVHGRNWKERCFLLNVWRPRQVRKSRQPL